MPKQSVGSNLCIPNQEMKLDHLVKVWGHEATKHPQSNTSVCLEKLNKQITILMQPMASWQVVWDG